MKKISALIIALWAVLTLGSSTAWSAAFVLIITPDEYVSQVTPLKSFKEATGRPTILVTLSFVRSNFTGVDDAERVKRCIEHYRNSDGIAQVLLVGDIDRFPARYQFWRVVLSPTDTQENFAVADLYYADLYKADRSFETWDSNGNGLYAEVRFQPEGNINQDAIDYQPDVAVGRLPASTADEVTRYVNKAIRYEIATNPNDAWFKRAGLYTGSWLQEDPDLRAWANDAKDVVGGYLTNQGHEVWKHYYDVPTQTPYPGNPEHIISDINYGQGVVNYIGHGAPGGWSCLSLWDSAPGLSADLTRGLSNTDMWPVVFASACDTGMFARMVPYQPYIDTNGAEHRGRDLGETFTSPPPAPAAIQEDNADHGVMWNGVLHPFDIECLGETFLFKYGSPAGSAGAVAYLGERTGGQYTSPELDKAFWASYNSGQRVLGELWKSMILQYYSDQGLSGSSEWSYPPTQWQIGHKFTEPMKFILFGDPSLRVGGAFVDGDLCGSVYDWNGGPLWSYCRYRLTCDVTVPSGQRLTAQEHSSVLFGYGRKITALDPEAVNGFLVNAKPNGPVGLLASPTSVETNPFRGVKLNGQFRLRNGGALKLY